MKKKINWNKEIIKEKVSKVLTIIWRVLLIIILGFILVGYVHQCSRNVKPLDNFTTNNQLVTCAVGGNIDTIYNNDYNDGYDDGYYDGYNNGYDDGVVVGENNAGIAENGLITMFNIILTAPFNIFNGLLNFELFGVNLFNVFSFIITAFIIIWVIKRFV